jgi:hypothetical protein
MYLNKLLEVIDISTKLVISIENSPIKVKASCSDLNQWSSDNYWLNKKIKSVKFTEEEYQEKATIILYK